MMHAEDVASLIGEWAGHAGLAHGGTSSVRASAREPVEAMQALAV